MRKVLTIAAVGWLAFAPVARSSAWAQGTPETRLLALIAKDPQVASNYLELTRVYYQDRRLADAERQLMSGLDLVRHQRAAQTLARQAEKPSLSKDPLRVGIDVPAPKRTQAVDPIYPPEALRAAVVGIVVIEAIIGKDGKVDRADVIKSVSQLDTAARNAVRQWRFEPTVQNGQPVEVGAIFALDFTLRSEPQVKDDVDVGKLYEGRHHFADAEFVLTRALRTMQEERRWFGARPGEGPVRVGASQEPVKTKDVRPRYPALAQRARAQGLIILEAVIDRQGKIGHTRIVKSQPLLDQAALDAVRQWEFTPTMQNGVPVEVVMTVTVNFTLTGR